MDENEREGMAVAAREVERFMVIGGQLPAVGGRWLPKADVSTADRLGLVAVELRILVSDLQPKATDTPDSRMLLLRAKLMVEETEETIAAMGAGDVPGTADGIADLLYVAIGAAVAFGIPLGPVWDAVHSANMAKFPACLACCGTGQGEKEVAGVIWTGGPIRCKVCNGLGLVAQRDAAGKVVKPDGWTPPDIAAVIREAGARQTAVHAKASAQPG